MKIRELVKNPGFNFNVHFRIVELCGSNDICNHYDSVQGRCCLTDELLNQEITSINTDDDGILEIEFVDEDW